MRTVRLPVVPGCAQMPTIGSPQAGCFFGALISTAAEAGAAETARQPA